MSEVILELINVVKKFDEQKAVNKMSVKINKGEFLTLLGPSGCGKTTTLRMIAGFETPTSGNILLGGQHVENKEPHERNVNTVFQNYALFPHMNVYDNIAYSLKIKKVNKFEIKKKVEEMLTLVQLEGFEKRKPDQLSGGQKQRVAIARSLINNPKVLLLDEPLGALDLKLRKQMQLELKRMQKRLGITFIYVTHDQEEAITMSDRIAVMNAGVIEQLGTPKEIYEKPKTRFVAGFIGEANIFDGVIVSISNNKATLKVNDETIIVTNDNFCEGEEVFISVRPENMKYSLEEPLDFCLRASIKEHIYIGSSIKTIALLSNGKEIIMDDYDKKALLPKEETAVWILWKPEDMAIVKSRRDSKDETKTS